MAKRDCYDVLGVTKSASKDEIKKAYRKLALKFHPDKTKGDKVSEEKFKEASEAYHILSDEKRKANYDQFGHAAFEGGGGGQGFGGFDTSSFSDIFEDFFSDFGGGGSTRRSSNRGNRNVQVRMALSIKEAMMNNEKTINYKLPSGRDEYATIKIPAGVQHGVTFKFSGMGDDSIKNMPRGDLMVQMSVLDSDGYTRKGNDLYTDKTIDCFQAIRGHDFNLKTLEDKIIKVKVPAGTQPGTILAVKGRGMPVHKTVGIRGNLYVKIHILIPQLSASDLKKIKDL